MKAWPGILPLMTLAALTLFLQSCVYPPRGYYEPRYLHYPPGYYEDDGYRRPMPRHHVRRQREWSDDRYDQDAPPPPRREQSTEIPREDRPVEQSNPPLAREAVPTPKSDIPTATRTGKANRVKSPYPPYSELDITGLPSGSLAKDPMTGEKFRVP